MWCMMVNTLKLQYILYHLLVKFLVFKLYFTYLYSLKTHSWHFSMTEESPAAFVYSSLYYILVLPLHSPSQVRISIILIFYRRLSFQSHSIHHMLVCKNCVLSYFSMIIILFHAIMLHNDPTVYLLINFFEHYFIACLKWNKKCLHIHVFH